MSFIPLLQAAQSPAQQNLVMTIAPFAIIIIIFYFFIIRPQNKKQKETEKMINALKKGDKVVTIGGIHGVVTSTKEKTVIVKVDSNASIEFNRSAIANVVVDKPAEKSSKKSNKDESKKNEQKTSEPIAAENTAAEEQNASVAEDSSENK